MSNKNGNEDMSISDFFGGKSIFITGGSGFIGKVLIEKLLRSCPNLKNIFMLIRPKKNVNIEERIRLLTNVPLFDKLRNENKNFLDKIIPVDGNIKKLKLGMNETDRKRIVDNVSIIINSAASVRFDDPLKDAVFTNVRSTREVMNLAQELKAIDVIVHISTLYANADNKVLEEKLYPRHDWRDVISLAENCEERVLEVLTQKFIHPLPNTYTFTKSVAELVVNEFCDDKIPAVIIRPSIVIPTGCDPIMGWIDNFNGPIGMTVAAVKGILKNLYCNPQIKLDYVFVDNVVKSIIVATWKKSLDSRHGKKALLVCNVTTDLKVPMTFNETLEEVLFENPPEMFVGIISQCYTKCWYNFYFRVLIQQLLPALLMDALLMMCGNKLRIMKIQRRIYIANMAVLQFLMNEWKSQNNNYLALDDAVPAIDEKNFAFFRQSEKSGLELLALKFWQSTKLYLLNEKPVATESEVKTYRLFRLAAKILKYAFIGVILYLVTWTYSLPTKTYEKFYNYISKLDS